MLAEALLIAVTGAVLSLVANSLSPRGLSLRRDYFGRSSAPSPRAATNALPAARTTPAPAASSLAASSTNTPTAPPAEYAELKQRLDSRGISLVDGETAEKLYHDPQYQQELIVFVDARDDHHYAEGHIPGAFQFDRYYPERYLPTVLPACLTASRIVVYCTGGKCEDSEFAAITLVESGIPAQSTSVYGGGMTDWLARKLPVESGPRKSGAIRENP